MSDREILLTAKLNRPHVTRDLVARPRLLARLDDGLTAPLTLVVAAAGFGKTTLVSSWIEELAAGQRPGQDVVPAAWLSLDDGDGDPFVFLHYFISALRRIFPGAAPQSWQLVTARQDPPLDYVAALLSNEIESLPGEFIMVLDDAHTARGQDIYEMLSAWMRHWPRPMHLVLTSRFNLPLSLANWRARGKVVELRPRDLRFTEAETAEFLRRTLGANAAPEAIAALHGQMEGWIAGLRLAMLSLRPGDSLAELPAHVLAGDVYVADYLLEEVLLRQPPEIQECLLTISVGRQFCESLCVALLAGKYNEHAARRGLDYLVSHELLQIPLDDRGEWLRFHHLFRNLLLERLQRERGSDAVRSLHRTAASWYAAQDLPDEALYHAREAGDMALMTDIMWQGLREVLNREDRPTLERWLAMLPAEVIDQSAELTIMSAYGHGLRWELPQFQRCARRAEALLEARTFSASEQGRERLMRAQLAIMAGESAYDRGEPAITAIACREGHDRLPANWSYVRGVAAAYVALGLQATGRAADADQFLAANYETAVDKSGGYALRLLLGLALNALQTGRLESGRQIAQTLLQQAESSGLTIMQGWGHYLIGYVRYHFGDLATAEQHYKSAAAMRYRTQLLVARNALSGLAQVFAAHGDMDRALAQIDDLSMLDVQLYGLEEPSTAATRGLLLARQGNADLGADWSSPMTLPPEEQPLLPWSEVPLLARLAVLVARNRPEDAAAVLHALDLLDDMAARTFNGRTPVALLAIRAMALLAQGDVGAARRALTRSVTLARQTGHRQLYVDMGEPMRQLLRQIAGARTVSATVRDILSAFPAGDEADEQTAPATVLEAERLTPRELEILRLLATPVSIDTIADELDITAATAKRHSINMYGKLGVHSRWDAVARAVELGILTPI